MLAGGAALAVAACLAGSAVLAGDARRGADDGIPGGLPPDSTADLILTGRIRTLTGPDDGSAADVAEAVAIRDGRVAAVGSREAVGRLGGSGTRTVDLDGATVVPAFTDHHVHLLNLGFSLLNRREGGRLFLDLSDLTSLEELGERVAARARETPEEGWILGKGWSQAAWGTQALPDRRVLDEAAPDRPVFLTRVDAHAGWTNSAGLEAAGIGAKTPDPPGGEIRRRDGGEPTGVLLERANEPVAARIPPPSDADVMAAFRLGTEALAARGVTEAYDAGFLTFPGVVALNADLERLLDLLVRADRDRPLPLRVHLMVPAPSRLAERVVAEPAAYDSLTPRIGVSHLKLFADGALGSRGAALTHPYADDPGTRGVPRMSSAAILEWSRRALDADLGVATHAIGDEAVRRTLDAYEQLLRERADLDARRLRIEHFSYARAEDYERAVRLGVVISMQSNFNSPADVEPSFAARRVGSVREGRVYAWRRLDAAGAEVAGGSDYFGLPGPALLDFHAALTTRNGLGAFGPGPAGRLPALRLQSRRYPPGGGAPAPGWLRPGDPGDLAVLSADPLTAPVEELLDITARATFRAGRPVHHDGSLGGLGAGGAGDGAGTRAGAGAESTSRAEQSGGPRRAPAPGSRPVWNVSREEAWIPMRDGVRLRATLLSPEGPGPFPCIVYRTPYSREAHEDGRAFPTTAARHGYLVVLVDVRGRYDSEGAFHAYRQERDDGHDTLEWVAAHPRCDGNVGTYGGSYPGFVQWLALAEEPAGLRTAAPDMTPVGPDHFFYQGGAFSLGWYDWFVPLVLPDLRRRAGDRSGPWTYGEALSAWEAARERWFAHRPLVDVPLLREYAPYFYDWLTHPISDTAFWAFADVEDELHEVDDPLLLLSGWYDEAYGPEGAARAFRGVRGRGATETARRETRLVLGPWTHSSLTATNTRAGELDFGPSAGLDYDAYLLDWFGRWLKGDVTGAAEEPPVRYFVMGENRWRSAATWPPAAARTRSVYLRSGGGANGREGDGRLSWQPPGTGEPPDRYAFDPRDPVRSPGYGHAGAVSQAEVEARDDVLVYTTAPLEEPLTVAGEITAELHVSSDAPDTDFAVMIADVHPDGTSYNVASADAGMLRMRYREGFDRQVLMKPGEVYRIRISGLHTAIRFGRDHRIRLQVTSSRYPFYAPNPNTGRATATENELVVARQAVWHDESRPSRVLLPVLELPSTETSTP